MRALLTVLALLLAGCSAEAPGEPAPSAPDADEKVDHVDESELNVQRKDLKDDDGSSDDEPTGPGALRLVVRDVAGRPVPDVEVIGDDRLGMTAANGTLEFRDLEPGPYHLRIQREAFRTLEVNVTVDPRVIKTIDLELRLQEGLLKPPHFHDYWQGRQKALLFETDWDVACYGSFGGLFGACTEDGAYQQGNRDFKFPDGATIWPGTGQLILTVSWEGTRDDLAVELDTPAEDHEQVLVRGEPVTYDVTPEMWDPPHASTSLSYLAFSPNAVAYHGVYEGPVHVEVTLVRGDEPLPFDPPHVDHWGGATQKRLDDRTFSYSYVRWGTMKYGGDGDEYESGGYTFPEGNIVIPGATEIVWRVWINETATSNDIVLRFTPEVDKQFGPGEWQYREPDTVESDYMEWRVPVADAWFDDVYATESTWAWNLEPGLLSDADEYGTQAWVADLHVIVDIVR